MIAALTRPARIPYIRVVPKRRRRPRFSQLPLWSPSSLEPGADLLPTSALLRHPSCARVLAQVRQVRSFFPELDGTGIKVGLTRRAAGFAAKEEPHIWINPRRLTRHTIAHEFVHLLQFRGLIPTGERSADLYALARHPVLADDLPCYLRIPRSLATADAASRAVAPGLLYSVAVEALERRGEGLRTYLLWFEEEISRRWDARQRQAPVGEAPRQVVLF